MDSNIPVWRPTRLMCTVISEEWVGIDIKTSISRNLDLLNCVNNNGSNNHIVGNHLGSRKADRCMQKSLQLYGFIPYVYLRISFCLMFNIYLSIQY